MAKKNDRLLASYTKLIVQLLGGKNYLPLSSAELIKKLHIDPPHLPLFKKAISGLIAEKKVRQEQGRLTLCSQEQVIISGTLRVHPRGFGFLQPDHPLEFPEDVFIPKHLTKNAVDGDLVEVLLQTEKVSEKGPEGRVLSILRRSRTHIAGSVIAMHNKEYALAFVPLFGSSKQVLVKAIDERPLKVGDRLIMKVLDWGDDKAATYCEMSHYLGHIDDPSCDVKASIEEFELRSDFPSAAIQEAQSFGKTVSTQEISQRVDLRSIECFTIDPETAKDFDDALSLTCDKNQHFHLGVHIADVSFYVRPNSPLDKEARLRCNSTYFPGYCLPMLPEELSSELCSLKPKVNRLTLSVMMHFDQEGNLLDHAIFRSCIKSAERFTYQGAKKVLDGLVPSPHLKTLNLMVTLCGLLKKKRNERGSVEFSMPETIVKVDAAGVPTGLERIEYDITHQLVEEFMLKANEVVATHLSEKGEQLTYRVHDEPSPENLKEFAELAGAFGFYLPHQPSLQDLQKLFVEAASSPFASHLATSFIRSQKLAYYSPVNVGHFGLCLAYYCHFTSPIRRYVDLVVHRLLFGSTEEAKVLVQTCHACSEQERISARAEQATVTLKKLRYLKRLHEEDPARLYPALVTRVKNMGFAFELEELALSGFLHVSELESDYFLFDEKRLTLQGRHTGLTYSCGSKITLSLNQVNFITLETSFSLLNPSSSKKRSKKRGS